jgi:diaminohydroxyphosphoribosylaminopyrimidine deaminase/5-amino-6-(5-phosphoribosylamino)uracil reductase
MEDSAYMAMALSLAKRGAGWTAPNPMVGAVVVKGGRVVGKGYHRAVGTAHAEVNAIDDAGIEARDATLYVTLEPCNHTGRTPPCTEKILAAGIRRVVCAMPDPNPKVAGGGNAFLASRGIDVSCGILEEKAEKLNESFVKYSRTGRPFVILKCAATLDGRLATRTGDSKWITGPRSRRFVHRIRHEVDAIMVGSGTVHADDPSLTTRLENRKGRNPRRIILDTRLGIPETAKVLRPESDSDTILVAGPGAPAENRARLAKRGATLLETPLKDGRIDLGILMTRLGDMGITSLLVEGGGSVLSSALADGIADKVLFFYAPKLLGGDDGVPICRGLGAGLMNDAVAVEKVRVRRFDDDVMIEGYIKKAMS